MTMSLYEKDILSTCFAPDTSQRAAAQAELVRQRAELRLIGEQMRTLQLQQVNLLESTVIYEELLSPMRRLCAVPEVLEQVFIHCLPHQTTSISSEDAPILLLQVCRRWRDVARGTPQLWTSLCLIPGPYEDEVDPMLIIPMWMQHVSALPFTVDLRPSDWKYAECRAKSREKDWQVVVLRQVMQRFSQCTSFKIVTTSDFLGQVLPDGTFFDAEKLTELDIDVVCGRNGSNVAPIGRIDAKNLSRLSLSYGTFVLESLSSSLSVLRHLSIRSWHSREFSQPRLVSLLSSCPSLEELDVLLVAQAEPLSAHASARIHLSALRSLKVSWTNATDPTPFLSAIRVTALRRFHLESGYGARSSGLVSALNALFLHSVPPLTNLDLDNIVTHNLEIGTWIASLHELETLRVHGGSLGSKWLTPLTPSTTMVAPWPCPRLKHVDLCGTHVRPEYQLLPFLRSRALQTSLAPRADRLYLEHVRVTIDWTITDTELEEVDEVTENFQGVEIVVRLKSRSRRSVEV